MCGILVGVAIAGLADPALGWGERTHEIINRRAVDFMPPEARRAWTPIATSLGMHASDADHRKGFTPGERERHFIDIDGFADHPFDDVPRDLDKLIARFGRERVETLGTVPWAIEECYRMVVLSLKQGDWSSAGAWAADLGHYVADSHQPLHCTVNYDGQNTGNDGVHLRFEVHMMNRHFDEATITPPAEPRKPHDDPVEFCFWWIAEAYPELQTVLEGDDRATAVDPHHGDEYYATLWSVTADVATRQVSRACVDLGALYTAAWEEAGSPAGPETPPPFSPKPIAALEPPKDKRTVGPGILVLAGAAVLGVLLAAGS